LIIANLSTKQFIFKSIDKEITVDFIDIQEFKVRHIIIIEKFFFFFFFFFFFNNILNFVIVFYKI